MAGVEYAQRRPDVISTPRWLAGGWRSRWSDEAVTCRSRSLRLEELWCVLVVGGRRLQKSVNSGISRRDTQSTLRSAGLMGDPEVGIQKSPLGNSFVRSHASHLGRDFRR